MTPAVQFKDLALASLRTVPAAREVANGLWNLIRIKPDSTASIGQVLEDVVAARPAGIALSFEGRSWTYAQFNAEANRYAAVLAASGVCRGDRVAILLENRPETLMLVAAVVKLGAVAGMLNHSQRGAVLAHSLALLDARAVVVGEECAEAWSSLESPASGNLWWEGENPAQAFGDLRAAAADASTQNPPTTKTVRASDTAYYIFTSGTTGMPKASRMSHYRWLRVMSGLGQAAMRLTPDDALYCALPLYHNNALTVSWSAVLGAGARLALARKFSASRFWDDVIAHDATAFCYIGELCRYLLNQPEKPTDRAHRVRICMGNGLRAEIWETFEQRFGITDIREFYGASEGNAGFINAFGARGTAGFCPLSYAIVEFDADQEAPKRDAKGFMQKVAKGGSGLLITEVTARSPFDGYTDSKASAGKLFHDVFKKGDCWFNSGDLVRDMGYRHIAFVDRVGDTFRWKGENVSTTEVEGVLAQCPGVAQAAVYGVEVPGCDGRAGMAAVTLLDHASFDGAAVGQALVRGLPHYAVPLFIRLKAIETTGTFKYRKVDLKRDGFDPNTLEDPLYYFAGKAQGYMPLSNVEFTQITQGDLRL